VSEVWTVRRLLTVTEDLLARRGIDEARLDSEHLLAHALSVRRIELFTDRDRPLTPAELDRFRALVRGRANERRSVAHLTGRREFYSLELTVTADVLVPRPETEVLVERALDEAARAPAAPILAADIGTGSGAIAIALAKLSKGRISRVVATELSPPAAAVARANAARHAAAVEVREGDLLGPLAGLEGTLALIVSNPPYIADAERASLAPEVLTEPALALFSGPDGLDAIRRIVADAPRFLAPGGLLLIEHGASQGAATRALAQAAGLAQVETLRDLAGRDRVLSARKN
jgi:release factor glutamine methyltransferase